MPSEQSPPAQASETSTADREASRPEQPAGPGAGGRIALGAVRLIALVGVVALAVIAAAILVGQDVEGWIVGLAIALGVQALTIFILFSRRFASRD